MVDTDKFVITKGVDNTFVFTVKADGSTLPMLISNSDTFVAKLLKLSDNTEVLSKSLSKVAPYTNGKVELVISAAETIPLVGEKGGKADRYYLRPVYKLMLVCNTEANGNFIAKIAEVYVD
jgi:hypothetical protein